ncbi:23S rRNA (guanosine-2'-O-)-methyltransferase RlmB [Aquicella siphonis]|uniref:23S rRNA (guanosine-2'-O-)-methyltransferase RlmB n=1 Tax=Aquicella siphonis TaxID=254247 RepID=A0A5E4PIC5_9COXI|nr:23S rRNA (guanosine(2251)-2'-O)-methyltransferase RlmB [Aquicella siphonis]VVC76704.1 23S rRNA (guanosine-2'-O-)-methyltransferase RlmB [Aquicella siphonis]
MSASKQYLFGLHAVEALLQNQPERVIRLCVYQDRQDKKLGELVAAAKRLGVPVDLVSRKELDRMTSEANHQGVAAFCTRARAYEESDLKRLLQSLGVPPLVLVLDGVQDPHNLGACFRSADAAGVHVIIAPKDKAVGVTPIVSKVASGAAETVPFVQVTNLVRALEALKELGIWIYGASGDAAQSLYQTDLTGPAAIVLGAEGSGLRRLTREHCDMLLQIPMRGSVSSLNVSVAAGVFLFEAVRQRSG